MKALSNRRGHVPDGLKQAMDALSGPCDPPTAAGIAEHNTLVAREMARATARRMGYSPQPELPLSQRVV